MPIATPAYGQAGVVLDGRPNLMVMLDYRHIAYGSVACVANPATNILIALFGADDGPGFGWRDIDDVKLGVEWRRSHDLTLRSGYFYNTLVVGSRNVSLNILAPATTQFHITAGGELKLNQNWFLELAVMYAPMSTVIGAEIRTPSQLLDIATTQYGVTLGVKYFFNTITSQ